MVVANTMKLDEITTRVIADRENQAHGLIKELC